MLLLLTKEIIKNEFLTNILYKKTLLKFIQVFNQVFFGKLLKILNYYYF